MQFILPLLYGLLFILLIFKMNFFVIESLSKTKLVLLFILKLIAGLAVLYVYTNHYSESDFQLNFSGSKILLNSIINNSYTKPIDGWNSSFETILFNNSRAMIILNTILQLFSFGNFYVHVVFFCFFSFIGLVALFKAFINHFPLKQFQLIIAIFLVPSVLFFSSAVLKEAVVISLVGLLIYFSDFGLKLKYSLNEKCIIPILFLLLVFVKIYVASLLLPMLLSNAFLARTSKTFLLLKYTVVFAFFALVGFFLKTINSDYNVLQLISDKQAKAISEAKGGAFLVSDKNFICVDYDKKDEVLIPQTNGTFKIKNGSSYLGWKLDNMADTTFVSHSMDTVSYNVCYAIVPANTTLAIKRLKPDLIDFAMFAPQALMNVLFQPTLLNIKSWLHLLAAIENLFLILIILFAIFFFDSTIIHEREVLAFCLVFTILLFILIGITTPVVGAIVRYRTIGMILVVPICLMMIDEKKMIEKFFKLK